MRSPLLDNPLIRDPVPIQLRITNPSALNRLRGAPHKRFDVWMMVETFS